MNKQKGFTLVEGLLIVLIVSVVGFAGYTVWNNQQDDESENTDTVQQETEVQENNEQSEEISETASTVPEGWTSYKNNQYNFSFAYPDNWTIEEKQISSTELSLIIKSEDYEEYEGAYGGTNKGSLVSVSVIDTNYEFYTSNENILNGNTRPPVIYREVNEIEVSGVPGISYIVGYEGPEYMHSKFEVDMYAYDLSLEAIINSSDELFNPNQETYQQIVDTLEIN
jgi:type II secretory pathway pseudopilin PulG